MMVYSALRITWLQYLLDRRLAQYLGRVSLSLYLVHMPLLWTASHRVYRLFGTIDHPDQPFWRANKLYVPDSGPQGLSTRFIVVQIVVFPVNLIFAEISTRLWDQPGITLSRWVAAKIIRVN